ncbi:hypothetical protein BABA_13472 [Neobacillus bataviensis LMG 21833]|uniref:Uncharacterized protein n=1 Tax=Neobacillus bataviensis LMG 21833 TaxID=1117379 RepID=K6E155_9BACI|nr:hypothetical protein BABA_13472 [Neobacillus bataviensis LMG 21833]
MIRCEIWLKRYLDLRKDKDPAIFVTERHPHRMSIGQMRYIIKRISSRAGRHFRLHIDKANWLPFGDAFYMEM